MVVLDRSLSKFISLKYLLVNYKYLLFYYFSLETNTNFFSLQAFCIKNGLFLRKINKNYFFKGSMERNNKVFENFCLSGKLFFIAGNSLKMFYSLYFMLLRKYNFLFISFLFKEKLYLFDDFLNIKSIYLKNSKKSGISKIFNNFLEIIIKIYFTLFLKLFFSLKVLLNTFNLLNKKCQRSIN